MSFTFLVPFVHWPPPPPPPPPCWSPPPDNIIINTTGTMYIHWKINTWFFNCCVYPMHCFRTILLTNCKLASYKKNKFTFLQCVQWKPNTCISLFIKNKFYWKILATDIKTQCICVGDTLCSIMVRV